LQKSWDLNYWVLEIFFHCLDESTAEYLQLSEEKNTASTSTIDVSNPSRPFLRHNTQIFPETTPAPTVLSFSAEQENNSLSQGGDEVQLPAWPENTAQQQPLSPPSNGDVDDMPIDLSEPFLFEEEFARNFGSCTPRLDSLNSSNLDFLYRYL
jgi:hypothetical protein